MASPYLTPERAEPRAVESPMTEEIKTKEALYRAIRAMTERLVTNHRMSYLDLPKLVTEKPDDMLRWSSRVAYAVLHLATEEDRTREMIEGLRIEKARLILIEGRDLEASAKENRKHIAEAEAFMEWFDRHRREQRAR